LRKPPCPGEILRVVEPGQKVTLKTWQFLAACRTVEKKQ
jgi:hypothetical protein